MGNIITKIFKFENGSTFEYSVSLKNGEFPVNHIAFEEAIPEINKAILDKKKDITVRVSSKVGLLQQLQYNGALEMDILKLVKNYTVKNIEKIADYCLKDSGRTILQEKNGYLVLSDFKSLEK